MAAAVQVMKGDKIRDCAICKLPIGVGQWEVHAHGRVYHHSCHSHGTPQPIEKPETHE